MTPDIMHIALGGGCLVMTGMTLHLYRLLADAAPKARKWDRLCERNAENSRRAHEPAEAKKHARTLQLQAEARLAGHIPTQNLRGRLGL